MIHERALASPAKEHPMATRLPASQRTREELTALIEGRFSTASAKDELVKLATRLIVEEALEGEAGDTIGRDYYEHGAQPGQGYRNGYRTGRLKTAEGLMEYSAPQIGARALGARHRGCVQRRERPAVVIEDSGVAAWRAAVGGLPGVCPARLERIRNHLSVCRWHCRAFEAWRQTRACSGGLGLYDRGPSGAAAYDGRLQGRCRDGDRVLRGHEEARSQ